MDHQENKCTGMERIIVGIVGALMLASFVAVAIMGYRANTHQSPKYKIGQKVFNGFCTGKVLDIVEGYGEFRYKIADLDCGDTSINFAYFRESEIL